MLCACVGQNFKIQIISIIAAAVTLVLIFFFKPVYKRMNAEKGSLVVREEGTKVALGAWALASFFFALGYDANPHLVALMVKIMMCNFRL